MTRASVRLLKLSSPPCAPSPPCSPGPKAHSAAESKSPFQAHGLAGSAHSSDAVRDWPVGFFVAGSSLDGVNGLFKRTENNVRMPHSFSLTYENKRTGWCMAFVNSQNEGYVPVGRTQTEWLFIDKEWRDRFGHKGDTYLPGAGKSWQHLHRQTHTGPEGFQRGDRVEMRTRVPEFWDSGDRAQIVSTRVGAGEEDQDAQYTIKLEKNSKTFRTQAWRMSKLRPGEENAGQTASDTPSADDTEELPWQVVAIMSEDKMQEMQQRQNHRDQSLRTALNGVGLAVLPPGSSEAAPPPPPPGVETRSAAWVSAEAAHSDRRFEDAAELYREAALAQPEADHWPRATLSVLSASCHRRAGNPLAALAAASEALSLFPQYKSALHEKGLALLEAGRPGQAVEELEKLLRVDRSWPDLSEWLVRGHVLARRRGSGPVVTGITVGATVEAVDTAHGYWFKGDRATVVGLGTSDAPLAIKLERSRRLLHTQVGRFRVADGRRLLPGAAVSSADVTSGAGPKLEDKLASHYEILGVPVDFTAEEIKLVYRQASRRMHPDKGGSADAFQRMVSAHAVLSDPEKRKAYDLGKDLQVEPDMGLDSVQKEVEQRYFPERYGFWVFGDPHAKKREMEAAEREQRERENRWQEEADLKRRQQQEHLEEAQHKARRDRLGLEEDSVDDAEDEIIRERSEL
ncbi:hypothetical protein CYMTET_37015 [Cymbomonas tetramitiformis]|uniref:J domain-containing protein n=1 Tax=Cymbomonas tetramitiformis TaxID=36881 RepID=A0AAE0CG46_9CHLO|nr:hypothetical protein CYMTET_37015 [Cymbomonas tetramitiformis]